MLKRSWCVTAIVVACSFHAPAATVTPDDRAQLLRLESVWNDAHARGDANVLDRLWADDIVVTVQRMPVMGKQDAIQMVRSARMRFTSYDTSDVRVRVYDNSALVTGRVVRTRVLNGTETMDNWRFTKMYVRRRDGWRVVAWHASESAP